MPLQSNHSSAEKIAANESLTWEQSSYYENAEKFMWVFWNEQSPFLTMFRQLDTRHALELACGHGRHGEYVLSNFGDRVASLVMMDILQSNIDWCVKRIRDQDRVRFICNSGTGFQQVDDASITAIFCYDAMVHFHRDVVRSYLKDAMRVLVPGGKALFHHSNYAIDPDGAFSLNPHARAFMSASLFRSYAEKLGLQVISQQTLQWGTIEGHDCLTLVGRPHA